MVKVSARPSRREAGGTGMGAIEFLGQCLEVPLADQGVGVAVGGTHAAFDHRGHALGQVATNVADLVLFATGDHRVVEDRLHRRR